MEQQKGRPMSFTEYFDAIRTLEHKTIMNPSPDYVQDLTPHLSDEQRKALTTIEEGDKVYFALPPVLVRDGFNIACYEAHEDGRIVLRYAAYMKGKTYGSEDIPYSAEAMNFAKYQWNERMISDTWKSFETIYVQDPRDLTDGYPTTKFIVGFTTNRDSGEIIKDLSATQSDLLNRALGEISVDNPLEREELRGGRCIRNRYNCARCGGELLRNRCTACGDAFDGKIHSTPLPEKVAKILMEKGHHFGVEPR